MPLKIKELNIENLKEALEHFCKDNERAKERIKSWYGMNEFQPKQYDLILFQAAEELLKIKQKEQENERR